MKSFYCMFFAFLTLMAVAVPLVSPGEKGTPAWASNVQVETQQVVVPVIAQGVNDIIPVFKAPWNCEITRLGIVPEDAISPTTYNHLRLEFWDYTGYPSELYKIAWKEYWHPIMTTAAFDYEEFTLTTENSKLLDEGDVLIFRKNDVGLNKMATPRLLAVIEYIPQS